jgi:phosphosulfolactate phosphohydrolase-like enzyme
MSLITLTITTTNGNTVITKMHDGPPVIEHYLNDGAVSEQTEQALIDYIEHMAKIVKGDEK